MKRIKYLITALLIVILCAIPCHADFGDYGGNYDYGGYDSYDYGGNDSYDYGGYDYDYDDDDDNRGGYAYYGGTYGSGSSGGGSFEDMGNEWVLGLIIVIGVAVAVVVIGRKYLKIKPGKGSSGAAHAPVRAGATRTSQLSLRPMIEYHDMDPNFSDSEFCEKLANMYVRFQNSWQAKDLSDLRPYLTDGFFNQIDLQLENYRRNRQTNRVERIAVLDVKLRGWKQENGNDIIVAELQTRIVDYVVDDETGDVIRGDRNREKFMTYEWLIQRSSGMTSQNQSGVTAQSCPHCGAQLDMNRSAVCEYCGSVVTSDTFDWAVSNIKGISQRTQ